MRNLIFKNSSAVFFKRFACISIFLVLCHFTYGQTLTIEDVTQVEGTDLVFTVNYDSGASVAAPFIVTVGYNELSATGGALPLSSPSDFNSTSQTLNFSGLFNESLQFTVATLDDVTFEGNEDFVVILSSNNPSIITLDTATGTILDNDTALISINDVPAINEGQIGITTLNFTVVLSASDPLNAITVNYIISGGNENANTGTLTFAAGTAILSQTITITTTGDTIIEPDEVVTVTLSNPSPNSTISSIDNIGTSSFLDDDACVAGTTAPIINNATPTVFCDDINISLNDYINNTPPTGTTLEWTTVSDPESPIAIFLTPSQINNPNPGTVYGFFWDDLNKCASQTLAITIVLNMTPEITATTGGEICGLGSVNLMVEGNIPDAAEPPTFNWYASDNPTDTVILDSGAVFSTPGISTTTTYYVEATANDCTSSRVPVVAKISPFQSAGTPTDRSSCSNVNNGSTAVDLDDSLTGESIGIWTITEDPSGSLTIDESNIVNFVNKPDGSYVFTFTTTMAEIPCINESSQVTITVNDCDIDTDLDGLFDGTEVALGTDLNNQDTDEDLINDADEVGADIDQPIDTDNDGTIDALESNILDEDNDDIVDQLDAANDNPCLPNRYNGACDTDGDGISDLDEQTNSSDEDDPCSPNATPDCDTPIDLEVLKTVDSENPVVGENVVFTITVNNLSNRTVKSVQIGELLESGFEYVEHTASLGTYNKQTGSWDINEMQALESIFLEIEVEVLDQGVYTNTAELLQSFPIDGRSENDSANANLNLAQEADLMIEKTVNNEIPPIGSQITFTITLTNLTMGKITNVEINELINDASGFSYVSGETSNGTYNENTGIWNLPEIEPEEVNTLKITAKVLSSGSYINTTTIASSLPIDENEENNEAQVILTPIDIDCVVVYNIFSQNENLTNDYLEIGCIDSFIDNSLEIYNRYGNKVYEAKPYRDKTWKGTDDSGDLPLGTYFYILDLGVGNEVRKGWIQIIR